jgi:hypothetical protein
MVRRAPAIARVGAPYLQPGPDRISPPRESPVTHGPGSPFLSSHRRIPSAKPEQKGGSLVPFILLVVLLVLAIVVLLLAVYFVVRRWL